MDVNDRFTDAQIAELAVQGVSKINRQGVHGATLCSLDEIIAMAAFIVRLEPLISAPPHITADIPDLGKDDT